MTNENSNNNEPVGFKINDRYFIEFPPGDFVKENAEGEMYIDVTVYENVNNNIVRLKPEQVTKEIEEMVNEAVNNILRKAIEDETNGDK